MRIGIITLPFYTNYGGILQAYALGRTLEELGHEAIFLQPEEIVPVPRGIKAICKYLRRHLLNVIHRKNGEIRIEKRICDELPTVGKKCARFISENMKVERYRSTKDIDVAAYDAFITGSDQIWRPSYSHRLKDAFLGFTKDNKVRRIAYAASFGVDCQEYSAKQKSMCRKLLAGFDAISVREQSGVTLCKEMFGIDACQMPDPTLLLDADVYSSLSDKSPHPPVFAYILDKNDDVITLVEQVFRNNYPSPAILFNSVDPRGLGPVSDRIQPSIEEWLGAIGKAEWVITDSFHACVFSILLHKNFLVVTNGRRGQSRICSLLSEFGLQKQLHTSGSAPELHMIDAATWQRADERIAELRKKGIDFLKEALR